MQPTRFIPIIRYFGTIAGSALVAGMALAFLVPHSVDAIAGGPVAKAPTRIAYGVDLPRLEASAMNIAGIFPVVARSANVLGEAQPSVRSERQATVAQPLPYYTAASALNVRARPSASSAVVAGLAADERVAIEQRENGWYRVSRNGQSLGWAYGRYLKLENAGERSFAQ